MKSQEINELKVSIITVCLNSEKTIEQTIRSVTTQDCESIEYIIIDGKSTDGTLDIVRKYQSAISLVVSEKDEGLFYAMNKGLRLATGDIVLFLNAGDYLYDGDVVKDVLNVFYKKPDTQLLYGNVVFDYGKRRQIREYKRLDRIFFACSTISHQVIFAQKALFGKYGFFDEELRIGADSNWLLNVWFNHKKEVTMHYLARIICVFDKKEGLSTKPFSYFDETIKIWTRYYNRFEWFFYYPLCLIRQKIRKMFIEKRV